MSVFSETCSAIEFAHPESFVTRFDTPASDEAQYATGLKIANEYEHVSIGVNGVWSAYRPDSPLLMTYEKIGHHRSTAALLRGFLAGKCPVYVHRKGCKRLNLKGVV